MIRKLFAAAIFVSWVGYVVAAENYMLPAADTLIYFVHGINSSRYTWTPVDNKGNLQLKDSNPDQWMPYIFNELKVDKSHLYTYSFSVSSGYHGKNMLELGGKGYLSEGGDSRVENNNVDVTAADGSKIKGTTGITNTNTWIDQARDEYKTALFLSNANPDQVIWNDPKDIPDALLPPKLVMIAHSQGNFAVRGYIQSGGLLKNSDIFKRISDREPNRLSAETLKKYEANPLGFYDYPVEKVVFINPVLRGSEVETLLLIRALKTLKTLTKFPAFSMIPGVKEGLEVLVDEILFMAATDEKFLEGEATNPLIRKLMEPVNLPMGIKMTKAEYIVKIGQLAETGANGLVQIYPQIAKWFTDPKGVGNPMPNIDWNGGLAALQNGLNVLFAPANIFNRVPSLAKMVAKDNVFPGQSYIKGVVYVADQLSTVINPTAIGPFLDVAVVSAFAPSVGDEYHVGSGGTEHLLENLVLDDEIQKVSGNYAENQRKWQPKYRMVNSNGSIAPNGAMTRAALV